MTYKVTVNKKYCKGCGLCVQVCPHQSLSLTQAYNQQGQPVAQFIKDGICIGCKQCAIICPDAAIEIKQSEKTTSKTSEKDGEKSPPDDR